MYDLYNLRLYNEAGDKVFDKRVWGTVQQVMVQGGSPKDVLHVPAGTAGPFDGPMRAEWERA